jgi:hypothetical protein
MLKLHSEWSGGEIDLLQYLRVIPAAWTGEDGHTREPGNGLLEKL